MMNLQEEDLQSIKRIYLLQGEQIDFYWGEIIEGLKACPGYFDYYNAEWTWEQVKTGHLLVWALSDGAIRGIVLTRISLFPKQKVFEILALYGLEMLTFFAEMEDVFMKIAQSYGCETIRANCRPGLKRLLKNFHVEHESMVLSRRVPQIGEQ